MMKVIKTISATAVSIAALALTAQAQVNLTGPTYSENFDSMGTTATYGTTGWTGIKTAGTGAAAVDSTLTPVVDNGAGTSGAVYNYGTTATTERALGSLASASTIPAFGAVFTNNTGGTIDNINIQFTQEEWHSGSSATGADTWTFQLQVLAPSITNAAFTSPLTNSSLNLVEILTTTTTAAAVDGNASGNNSLVSGSLSGLGIPNGSTFAIRWVDVDNTGSDAGMAIDNFSMNFAAIPEPATYMLLGVGLLVCAQRVRRRGAVK
jgi:hypothetical protein